MAEEGEKMALKFALGHQSWISETLSKVLWTDASKCVIENTWTFLWKLKASLENELLVLGWPFGLDVKQMQVAL